VSVSYRDFSQFAPPTVFSVVLSLFERPAVFVAGGVMMLGMAGLCRYIPRRVIASERGQGRSSDAEGKADLALTVVDARC